MFQNLLNNAIEYSGDGVGIDPEYTDRIFEMLQSLHDPDEHSGTGIGLALCERIGERHDVRLWVESPGEGSTFSFMLPEASDHEK